MGTWGGKRKGAGRPRGINYKNYYEENREKYIINAKNYYEENREKCIINRKKNDLKRVSELKSYYIKDMLRKQRLPITPEIIELKRQQVMLYRAIREGKNDIRSRNRGNSQIEKAV